jgi:hypothetical protein
LLLHTEINQKQHASGSGSDYLEGKEDEEIKIYS